MLFNYIFHLLFLFFLASTIIRTCTDVSIDDCSTTNNEISEHVCICKRNLCNNQSLQSILDELGIIDIDDEEDDDSEFVESGDDEFKTIHTTNWPTLNNASDVMETISNNSVIVPSINESVTFNLSFELVAFCLLTSVHKSFSNS